MFIRKAIQIKIVVHVNYPITKIGHVYHKNQEALSSRFVEFLLFNLFFPNLEGEDDDKDGILGTLDSVTKCDATVWRN